MATRRPGSRPDALSSKPYARPTQPAPRRPGGVVRRISTMKRILTRVFLAVVTIAAAGIALGAFRPDLVPAWARLREPRSGADRPTSSTREAPKPLTSLV